MLHLALVQEKDLMGKARLQLLAHQTPECTWTLQGIEAYTLMIEASDYGEGSLVLVKLTHSGQVEQVQAVKVNGLEFVEQHLPSGITPMDLQQEEQRAEQWRQSLTLQSQELGRRALEMEEENLRQEKKQLELKAAELEENAQDLGRRSLELEARWTQIQEAQENLRLDVEARWTQIQETQESLRQERQQLELKAAELELKALELKTHQ
jgi:hypothetical protein